MKAFQYSQFAYNKYSQFGEDGIIQALLERLDGKDNWCVEFGAWDGVHLSNSFNLIKNSNYRSILIEADKNKFSELKKNLSPYDPILLNEFVTFDGCSMLDNILSRTPVPSNFDFLSIDIDGNDYWIFESLKLYRPKIICIEYNPSIPNDVEYIQARDFSVKKGSSALSICKLAKLKSYELVATTYCNLMLVDKEYFNLFQITDNSLISLRDDSKSRVYAFVGYDGTILHSKPIHLIWHGVTIEKDALQGLPKFLRKFPSDYGIVQKLLFFSFLILREPTRTLRRVCTKFKLRDFKKNR